jgi:hypothetical protein
LVRRRHMHVGAPENRIVRLLKEHVLMPRGRDMNPELGLGGHRLTGSRLPYQAGWGKGFLNWLGKGKAVLVNRSPGKSVIRNDSDLNLLLFNPALWSKFMYVSCIPRFPRVARPEIIAVKRNKF